MSNGDRSITYLNLLEQWARSTSPYLYDCPDRPGLSYYGTGENGWGVQTNQKAFAAFAMLAADPRFREDETFSKESVKALALRLLRFSLQSHIEGDYHCTDGTKWGHTWISALGIERMMHGVQAIESYLTEGDKSLLRKVLISESDWLLDHYKIEGGLYNKDGKNKPESNIWNGALLFRTAAWYPDCPGAELYLEKARTFFINGVSVPSDAFDETIMNGKKISERFAGANFFESMALNHHGYLNVGYMVICLSNLAMLHFMYRSQGTNAPEELYRHVRELWDVVKLCTFPDGRLLRIGGDTRIRYTYCQDYVIPVWHMMKDVLGDPDCDRFEEGWLQQIKTEMDAGDDGSFLSRRCDSMQEMSPLYYTRLESDRASALSMGLAWGKFTAKVGDNGQQAPLQPIVQTEPDGSQSWHDEYHGAYLHRGKRRIASWVWESGEKPQGICLPPDCSDMAEWKENMAGRITGLGRVNEQWLEQHDGNVFTGGFVTWGSLLIHTQGLLAEGQPNHNIARNRIVCAALPDDKHMIVLQHAEALEHSTYVKQVKGFHLLIPNDIFNGNSRTYFYGDEHRLLEGQGSGEELIRTGSVWLNVDDRLGVIAAYGPEELSIYRPGRRQIGLRENLVNAGTEGGLYADELCGPYEQGLKVVNAGKKLIDAGFVIQADEDHTGTKKTAETDGFISQIIYPEGCVRGVIMKGADGSIYALAANFGDTVETITLEGTRVRNVADGKWITSKNEGLIEITIQPGQPQLLQVERSI
ncbi:hypothetical protein ABE504_21975 [Paenibacillus oryzisoli]|uniref:hypothetical protein n=1 Tax=Paenibacillus oryzisoli TaxID=1850517 RepID=UPI003D289647